jgi:hypothetical protein
MVRCLDLQIEMENLKAHSPALDLKKEKAQ